VTTSESRSAYPKFAFLGETEAYERAAGTRNNFRKKIGLRNGIIYIENYWANDDGEMTGCHIDLWKGSLARTKNELFYHGRHGPPDLRFDDVADRVVFWEIIGGG